MKTNSIIPSATLQFGPFPTIDVPPLADPVLLELPGLDWNLPLHLHLRHTGSRLPGLHVRGHIQAPAAWHSAANTVSGTASLPQGEIKYRNSGPMFSHLTKKRGGVITKAACMSSNVQWEEYKPVSGFALNYESSKVLVRKNNSNLKTLKGHWRV